MLMHLIHLSTIKQIEGTTDIDVFVVNEKKAKKYTYTLPSDFLAKKFHKLYKKGKKFHGKALTILNKNKIQ